MKWIIVLIKLLFLGALFIVSNHDLALSQADDRAEFNERFGNWIDGIFAQSIDFSGYILKSEWLPEVDSSIESEWKKIKD